MTYQADHRREPSPGQLSAYLASLGYFGRNGKPLSASNLRRHYLRWRIYNIWTTHQTRQDTPSADDIAQECAAHGITGQYNRPVTTAFITDHTTDFQRRRQALTNPHTNKHHPNLPLHERP